MAGPPRRRGTRGPEPALAPSGAGGLSTLPGVGPKKRSRAKTPMEA